MKKITVLIAFSITLIAVLGIQYAGDPKTSVLEKVTYIKPCETVVTYRVGEIDPKFNISEIQASTYINEAATIWAQLYGKDIFKEDPEGQLSISFVYDERQELRSEADEQKASVNNTKLSLEIRISNYQDKLEDYNNRVAQINKEIDMWNKKGGAPENVYNRINNQIKSMGSEAYTLNQEAEKLNKEAEIFGKSVETLQNKIADYSAILDTKPEEGLYDPNNQTITIYLINGKDELVSTLAHEFGHALGMEHVTNENAVMYSFANSNLKPTVEDVEELSNACRKVNRFKVIWENIRSNIFVMLRSS